MAKILICYYSRTQHTERMAQAVRDAAKKVAGATVELKPVDKVQPRELRAYDAIIMGSPTYYGSMAAELKKFIDDSIVIHGKLAGKVGGAFSSSANVGGGNETTILDILKAMLVHGMVIQGSAMGDHYGPVAVGDVDDRAIKYCHKLGKSVAELAVKLHG